MSEIYVVGVGMTAFGKFLDRSIKDMTQEAVSNALRDAGCKASDVEAAWFSNTTQGLIEGQHLIRGQISLAEVGFEEIPIFNVENACASAGSAFNLACAYIRAGMAEVTMAVGAEKMYSEDKEKSFAIFDGGWDVHRAQEFYGGLMELGKGVAPPEEEGRDTGKRSVMMDVYAALARFHMKSFGSTQRQMAKISSKNHRHSTLNPLSQYRSDMSEDEVMKGRMIAWPLTLPMCAPISDGAAAAILCSKEALSRFDRKRALRVRATVVGAAVKRRPEELDRHVACLAGKKAYEQAGIGPKDISLAELHDATAFAELLQTETMGFCEFGEGGHLVESGATSIGGRIPVNPSGGLESKGHPIGVTGLAMIHELATQIRGEAGPRQVENARFGLAENGGGNNGLEEAVTCVTILGRD